MIAWRDLVHVSILPVSVFWITILDLYFVVNEEFKDTEFCRCITNRILAIFKLDRALFVEVYWVSQVIVYDDICDVGLVSLERGTSARPRRTIFILLEDIVTRSRVHLTALLHSEWHCISIVAVEAKRAHRAIDAYTARSNAVGVRGAFRAYHLS